MGVSRSRAFGGPAAAVAGALVVAACGSFGSSDPQPSGPIDDATAAASGEGGGDGSVPKDSGEADAAVKCDATSSPFDNPTFIPGTTAIDSARFGSDGALYVTQTSGNKKALGVTQLLAAGGIDKIKPLLAQPAADDEQPMLAPDGLALIFQSDRSLPGFARLFVSSRATAGAAFTSVTEIPFTGLTFTATTKLQDPWLTPTRLYFVISSDLTPNKKLQVGDINTSAKTIENVRDVFATGVMTGDFDHPVLSSDELEIFYTVDGGLMFRAVRKDVNQPFDVGAEVTALATGAAVRGTWISPDGCDLYYFTESTLGNGLHRALRR